MATDQAIQAQAIHQENLLNKSNVVGVAVGYKESKGELTDEVALVVLVEAKKPLAALSADDMIPRDLEGMRTDVYEVGYIVAQATPRDRFRPIIPSGVSIGHPKVTAGTLGTIVRDRDTNEKLILSNNHVLANSNDALVGDPILQPGDVDGGQNPADMVAHLERFIPLHYVGDPSQPPPGGDPGQPPGGGCDIVNVVVSLANLLARLNSSDQRVQAVPSSAARQAAAQVVDNLVDAAVAKPINPDIFSGEIRNIGQVSGTKAPALGMQVRKSGRTTDYTEGLITLLNATVNVAYNTNAGKRTARFTGQVITQVMSQGGDSGSLIVDKDENVAVGLLFAGSSVSTIFTPINRVLDALNVTI